MVGTEKRQITNLPGQHNYWTKQLLQKTKSADYKSAETT